MRIRVGAAVIFSALALPGMADAAAPAKGAYYVAKAPGIDQPVFFRVSADGRRMASYFIGVEVPCSDGKSRDFALNHVEEKRFGITADGRFDFTSAGRYSDGPARGARSFRLVGSFSGDQATLTVDHKLSGSLRCNGATTLTFNRVGSPLQPRSDGLMTTGRYVFSRRGSSRRIRVSSIRAAGPARVLEGLTVSWSVRRCARGGSGYRDNLPFHPFLVSPSGRFKTSESASWPLGRGQRARVRFTLALRVQRRGAYLLTGTWKATTRIYRRGKQIDTCRTSQRFRSVARG